MSLRNLHIDKPFDQFKWRWMEVTPVETLNRPDIFLGITRALQESEGDRASSATFLNNLARMQHDLIDDLETTLNLIPTNADRNLIRRQGRYWTGLGVLESSRPGSRLTEIGLHLALGEMTIDEFVLDRIDSHTLPNQFIENDNIIRLWGDAGIEIKPLRLVLDILDTLERQNGEANAYITPNELIKVIIPMSRKIASLDIVDFASGLLEYRNDPECVSHFPNCVERANDRRMAREHLLFLDYYEVLVSQERLHVPHIQTNNNYDQRYKFGLIGRILFSQEPATVAEPTGDRVNASESMRNSDLGSIRVKRIAEIMTRPNQRRFRQMVMNNFNSTCLLSRETTPDVLDACHIISVSRGGNDNLDNGLCLRTDLHKLFDSDKIRIASDGVITLSPDIQGAVTYTNLPSQVTIPDNISRDYLRRKWHYGPTWVS